MQRYASILHLRPEFETSYRLYHSAVWPEILARITACNIRNYSIFLRNGMLFSYFEYIGNDFATDMLAMANDEKTKEWWAVMEPMQVPLPDRSKGEWWASMEEVFHVD